MSVKKDYTQVTVNDENLENDIHLECLGCKLDLPSLSGGDLPLDVMEVILQIQANGGDLNNLSDSESFKFAGALYAYFKRFYPEFWEKLRGEKKAVAYINALVSAWWEQSEADPKA